MKSQLLFLIFNAVLGQQYGQCWKENRPKDPEPGNKPDPNNQNPAPVDNGCLGMHNQYRQRWNVKTQLRWSASLAAQAQSWANNLNARRTLQHSSTNQGENLYMGNGKCSSALEAWMSEKYRGGPVTGSNFQSIGHLTQVIWKDTQEVGCASSGSIVVCRYYPGGNVLGESPT